LLRVFRSPACFSAEDVKVNSRAKKFVYLGLKRNMKGYKLWHPENKKIMLSKHVTFDETSLLKSTISQQVETLKIKDVLQRVEVDITLPPPIGSVSIRTSLDVTPGGDHMANFDADQVEDIDENVKFFAAIGTKINLRKWMKKHESQVGEHEKVGRCSP